jgi:hypothetical protein
VFLRIDRLQVELPQPTKADPNSAAALQELLGGKFGEMSTLNNYFFQSFNFRNKGNYPPMAWVPRGTAATASPGATSFLTSCTTSSSKRCAHSQAAGL